MENKKITIGSKIMNCVYDKALKNDCVKFYGYDGFGAKYLVKITNITLQYRAVETLKKGSLVNISGRVLEPLNNDYEKDCSYVIIVGDNDNLTLINNPVFNIYD